MRKFLVLVYGRNFRLPFTERRRVVVRLTGFYTTRCVEAKDASDAEYKAMDLIRADQKLRGALRNERTDPPIMHAVEISEVATFPIKPPGSGYAFFHGRGAGRPRSLELASFTRSIPAEVRKAVEARYGPPKTTRSSPSSRKRRPRAT